MLYCVLLYTSQSCEWHDWVVGYCRWHRTQICRFGVIFVLWHWSRSFSERFSQQSIADHNLVCCFPYFSLALCIPAVIDSSGGRPSAALRPVEACISSCWPRPRSIPPRKTVIMEADCRVCDDDKKPTACQAISEHEEKRKLRGEINGASNTRGFLYWPPYGAVCYNRWHMVLRSAWWRLEPRNDYPASWAHARKLRNNASVHFQIHVFWILFSNAL